MKTLLSSKCSLHMLVGPIFVSRISGSKFQFFVLSVLFFEALSTGCFERVVENISVDQTYDPLDQVIIALTRYAKGKPLGSEAVLLQSLAQEVGSSNEALGKTLESGFILILQSSPNEREAIASELLKQIESFSTNRPVSNE